MSNNLNQIIDLHLGILVTLLIASIMVGCSSDDGISEEESPFQQDSSNLLINGTFEHEEYGWEMITVGNAEASMTIIDQQAVIVISSSGNLSS